MKTRRAQLWFEQLERRLVPSAVLNYSSNWSGYAIAAGPGAVSAVSAVWMVPAASGPNRGYESTWVGIDGLNLGSVEQIGTESDFVEGHAHYYAWYEMYPNPSVTINQPIKPADQITASVSYDALGFTLTISNTSWSEPFTTTIQAPAQRSSAEWVVEAPSSDRVLPLASFGSETFTNAKATINNAAGAINAVPGTQVNQIDMVSPRGNLKDQASPLNAAGTGFTVTSNSSSSAPSSANGGNRTASKAGSHDNNQTATVVLVPPLRTVSPDLVLVPQLPPVSGAVPQIDRSVGTPSTLAATVRTGGYISLSSAAAAANDNAPDDGMATPAGAPHAPAATPPAVMPPAVMPPAVMPSGAANTPRARRDDSAPAVIVVQQADGPPVLVQDLAVSIDLANTGEAPVEFAGVVLVLACGGSCGIGASDPAQRPRASSKLRNP